ncbi:hypothetical protein M8C21_014197, partial [Ambrosia artemisiifolia]
MDHDEEVVIIGAGICGLATALALHKKGIKSVVMERSESLRNVTGAAIGIRPNGWRALDQLGIGDNLRHTAVRIQRAREISLVGGTKKELSLVPWDGETRCLRRKDLIDTLYAALPIGTVKFGCQLESIKPDPRSNKPVLCLNNGSSITPKVVIGCDGAKSIIADFLNLKPTRMFPSSSIRGLTNYPNDGKVWEDPNGTVTVAGDAMHVMGPFLGQGGSAGLEDAVVLARTMAQLDLNSVASGSKVKVHEVEEAFNLYVKQRRMR